MDIHWKLYCQTLTLLIQLIVFLPSTLHLKNIESLCSLQFSLLGLKKDFKNIKFTCINSVHYVNEKKNHNGPKIDIIFFKRTSFVNQIDCCLITKQTCLGKII